MKKIVSMQVIPSMRYPLQLNLEHLISLDYKVKSQKTKSKLVSFRKVLIKCHYLFKKI